MLTNFFILNSVCRITAKIPVLCLLTHRPISNKKTFQQLPFLFMHISTSFEHIIFFKSNGRNTFQTTNRVVVNTSPSAHLRCCRVCFLVSSLRKAISSLQQLLYEHQTTHRTTNIFSSQVPEVICIQIRMWMSTCACDKKY